MKRACGFYQFMMCVTLHPILFFCSVAFFPLHAHLTSEIENALISGAILMIARKLLSECLSAARIVNDFIQHFSSCHSSNFHYIFLSISQSILWMADRKPFPMSTASMTFNIIAKVDKCRQQMTTAILKTTLYFHLFVFGNCLALVFGCKFRCRTYIVGRLKAILSYVTRSWCTYST